MSSLYRASWRVLSAAFLVEPPPLLGWMGGAPAAATPLLSRGVIYGPSVALGVSTPTVDLFTIEAPVASNLEFRQLFPFDQPVDRRRMYPQVFRNVFDCQDRCHCDC